MEKSFSGMIPDKKLPKFKNMNDKTITSLGKKDTKDTNGTLPNCLS